MKTKAPVALLVFAVAPTLFGQEIQVSRSNKTIEITVTQTVRVDPEIALIEIGYQNYGPTRDSTMNENVKASNKIIEAIEDGGIPKADIETAQLAAQPAPPYGNFSPQEREARQYEAEQGWRVRVPVSWAQRAVDLALNAGANEIGPVDWTMRDPEALEDKAITEAAAKARAEANEILSGLGEKLGGLLYASNTIARLGAQPVGTSTETVEATAARPVIPPELRVHLFPKTVEKSALVHVVFAIE